MYYELRNKYTSKGVKEKIPLSIQNLLLELVKLNSNCNRIIMVNKFHLDWINQDEYILKIEHYNEYEKCIQELFVECRDIVEHITVLILNDTNNLAIILEDEYKNI